MSKTEQIQKCQVLYKGSWESGEIIEQKFDKVKVKRTAPKDNIFPISWYSTKEIKRVW